MMVIHAEYDQVVGLIVQALAQPESRSQPIREIETALHETALQDVPAGKAVPLRELAYDL